jgi:Na+/proline symporter
MVFSLLPPEVGFSDALHIAGEMDRLNAIDFSFDINNRYNIWSGIIGGFFLHLSYFGTDQSQVGRYLTAKSTTESRFGLIMNGLLKIPMQFMILFIGTLVFVFYQFNTPPVFFNELEEGRLRKSTYHEEYSKLEKDYNHSQEQKREHLQTLLQSMDQKDKAAVDKAGTELKKVEKESQQIRNKVIGLIKKNDPEADTNDGNYIFLSFVTKQLPVGVIGLLIAMILLASMGAVASGLNSLASTTIIDFYKRLWVKDASEQTYLNASRWATIGWGIFCILAALYASKMGNLIEAVNILGSLFYGTILGIFLVAFYLKKVEGSAVFYSAIITESFVVYAWLTELMTFLWLNVVGCLLVILIALVLQKVLNLDSQD